MACPAPGCGLHLPPAVAEALLSGSERQRYSDLLAARYVDSNPALKWCPRPGCSHSVALADALQSGGDSSGGGHAAVSRVRLCRQICQKLEMAFRMRACIACINRIMCYLKLFFQLPNMLFASQTSGATCVDVRCKCGHEFCWACQGEAHEPARCSQVHRNSHAIYFAMSSCRLHGHPAEIQLVPVCSCTRSVVTDAKSLCSLESPHKPPSLLRMLPCLHCSFELMCILTPRCERGARSCPGTGKRGKSAQWRGWRSTRAGAAAVTSTWLATRHHGFLAGDSCRGSVRGALDATIHNTPLSHFVL